MAPTGCGRSATATIFKRRELYARKTGCDAKDETSQDGDTEQSSAQRRRPTDGGGAKIFGPVPDYSFWRFGASDHSRDVFRSIGKYPDASGIRAVRRNFRIRHHHREFFRFWLCVGGIPHGRDQE